MVNYLREHRPRQPHRRRRGPHRRRSLAALTRRAALADPELAARLRLVLNRLARRLRNQTPGDLSPR